MLWSVTFPPASVVDLVEIVKRFLVYAATPSYDRFDSKGAFRTVEIDPPLNLFKQP